MDLLKKLCIEAQYTHTKYRLIKEKQQEEKKINDKEVFLFFNCNIYRFCTGDLLRAVKKTFSWLFSSNLSLTPPRPNIYTK